MFLSRSAVWSLLLLLVSATVNAQQVRLTDNTIRGAVANYTGTDQNAKAAIEATYGAISNWDVRAVSDMSELFQGLGSFNEDISAWRVVKVTTMARMFNSASSFNGDLSNWQIKAVTDMSMMFQRASAFRGGDLTKWVTTNVIDMSSMFMRATNFNGDITTWDTSKVTDMSSMFESAVSFNQDLSSWDLGACGDISYMFSDALAMDQSLCWSTIDEAITTSHIDPFCGSGVVLDPCCVTSETFITESCCTVSDTPTVCSTVCETATDAATAATAATAAQPPGKKTNAPTEGTAAPTEAGTDAPLATESTGATGATDATDATDATATEATEASPTMATPVSGTDAQETIAINETTTSSSTGGNDTFTAPLAPFSFTYALDVASDSFMLDDYLKEQLLPSFPNLESVNLDMYHAVKKETTPAVDGSAPANNNATEAGNETTTRMLRANEGAFQRVLQDAITTLYYMGNVTFAGPPFPNDTVVQVAVTDALTNTDALVEHLNTVTNVKEWSNETVTVTVGDSYEAPTEPPSNSGTSGSKGLSTTGLVIVIVAACIGGISLLIIIFVGLAKPSNNVRKASPAESE